MARNATTYKAAVKSFNVETNPKYQPSGGTKCNVFAFDVMKHPDINTPLPTKAECGDTAGGSAPALCNQMLDKLTGGTWSKWVGTTPKNAQVRANNGYPTIAITSDHMAVVIPNGGSDIPTTSTLINGDERYVRIAQAGMRCFFDDYLTEGWPIGQINKGIIKYYYWFAD